MHNKFHKTCSFRNLFNYKKIQKGCNCTPLLIRQKMMKKTCLISSILFLFCNIHLFAQGNETDAFNISNTGLGGTARSVSMGGAFGALGGDISVISNNPAGLGIYRSSEISATLDLSVVSTATDWSGMKNNQSKTRFSPGNYGFEFFFPTSSGVIRNWNVGLSFNRVKNYNRKYRMESKGQPNSISSYIATRTSNAFEYKNGYSGIQEVDLIRVNKGYNPYNHGKLENHWLSILGYESGMFGDMVIDDINDVYQSAFGYEIGNDWGVNSPAQSLLYVSESGSVDEYNVGFGMNISNFLFLGASVSVTDIKYKYNSGYEELFSAENSDKYDHLYLNNWLNTEGNAATVNVGAIVSLNKLRLGVAYNSPRWYKMTDYYNAGGGTHISSFVDKPKMEGVTPNDAYSEYKFSSPGQWIFSGAFILGSTALISADYEIMDYRKMNYSDMNGNTKKNYDGINTFIEDYYTFAHTIKIGTEVKIIPQFAVRAGYMVQKSPMHKRLSSNTEEVIPTGTIPHFTVTSNPTTYYTFGAGYRFTPNFSLDMALVFRNNSAYAYAFSNTYFYDPEYDIYPITSEPAKLTTKAVSVMLSANYKF